jgi:ABC-type nitrate/sulfonate/bicarbonate transport system ATPase subunit
MFLLSLSLSLQSTSSPLALLWLISNTFTLGAGKTTLLDLLARRKNTGRWEGEILLNGQEPDDRYHRYIGYVEQSGTLC